MKRGLFVLAHGSRAKEADATLKKIVKMLEERNLQEFSMLGYGSLQFSTPNFQEGIDTLIKKGAEEIVIVPMFLFEGNHIKYDIPEELEIIREKYPKVQITMAKPIGPDKRIADIVEERGKEALASF